VVSIDSAVFENISFQVLVLQYSSKTKRSCRMACCCNRFSLKASNAGVTTSNDFQVSQAEHFPFPANYDISSQPVKAAWKAGSAAALLGPIALTTL